MKRRIFASILFLFFSLPANADEKGLQPYAGFAINHFYYEEESFLGVTPEFDLYGLSAILGVQMNPYLAAELRGGYGLIDDNKTLLGVDVDFQINHFFGAYLKGELPIASNISPYVVLGYTNAELEIKAQSSGITLTESDSSSDFSYGAGIKVYFDDKVFLTGEYMHYVSESGFDVSGFTLSLHTKF